MQTINKLRDYKNQTTNQTTKEQTQIPNYNIFDHIARLEKEKKM